MVREFAHYCICLNILCSESNVHVIFCDWIKEKEKHRFFQQHNLFVDVIIVLGQSRNILRTHAQGMHPQTLAMKIQNKPHFSVEGVGEQQILLHAGKGYTAWYYSNCILSFVGAK